MNKIYLGLVCLFLVSDAIAQNANPAPQEGVPPSAAINIAVSRMEDTDGDEYFADAEKNERRGDLNEALTLFGKAAFEYNSDKKFSRYAASLLRMSNVHLLLLHYTEAEQVILNAALKTYTKIGSKSGQMASYNQLGRTHLAANKLTQSLWFYTQQGILAQQLKNNTAYIEFVLGIASVKIKKKEYAMASRDVNRAELLAKNANITQFAQQIKMSRATIAEKQVPKAKTR